MTTYNVQYDVKRFTEYEPPSGMLAKHKACHALFYYYLLARKNYENERGWEVVLEGDRDPIYKYKELISSIATAYGTNPEEMVKFWLNVDMQADLLKLPRLPEMEMYRFNNIIAVKGH